MGPSLGLIQGGHKHHRNPSAPWYNMLRIAMSVTQQNSDLAGDSTEFADEAKKKNDKHQDKLKCAEGKQDGCSNP